MDPHEIGRVPDLLLDTPQAAGTDVIVPTDAMVATNR
jgi:hypothetical protein